MATAVFRVSYALLETLYSPQRDEVYFSSFWSWVELCSCFAEANSVVGYCMTPDLGHKIWHGFYLALSFVRVLLRRTCHHAVRKPKLACAERPNGKVPNKQWAWERREERMQVRTDMCEQVQRWCQPPAFRSSYWGPDTVKQRKPLSLCLMEFLTHRICETNRLLSHASKFWGNLFHSHSNWNKKRNKGECEAGWDGRRVGLGWSERCRVVSKTSTSGWHWGADYSLVYGEAFTALKLIKDCIGSPSSLSMKILEYKLRKVTEEIQIWTKEWVQLTVKVPSSQWNVTAG